jgi:hypothetical protein
MRKGQAGSLLGITAGALLAVAVLSVTDRRAHGQAYAPPRTNDGKPDLQGIWQVLNTADVDIQDHSAGSTGPAGQGVVEGNEVPYQASAQATKKKNYENRLTADPARNCFLPGVPRVTYLPFPFQIIQTPGYVAIAYEFAHVSRMIRTDGSKHQQDIDSWMGDSRGRWEDDSLVVDVTQFNDLTWLDRAGNFHSDALHVVERYTRLGPDHIQYEATLEDPKVFTRPWKMRMFLYRRKEPNVQLLDYQCYAFDHDKKGLSIPLAR